MKRFLLLVAVVAPLAAGVAVRAAADSPGAPPEDTAPKGDNCAVGGVSGTAPAEPLGAGEEAVSLERVNEAASKMICTCGCGNMVLSDCECGEAAQDKQKIRRLLAEGKGPEEIVAVFVSEEGEIRRAAPTKKGFNLIVWVAPFVALVLGGTFLGWVLRSWTRRKPPSPGPHEVHPLSKEDRDRLDDELRRGA
jgi:cytochrome c-type biogenesis protein CcmH